MRACASVALVTLGTAIAGCGDDATSVRTAPPPDRGIVASIPDAFDPGGRQAPGTFVGAAKGDRAYVGFVLHDNRAVVYVCDGAYGDWFGAAGRGGHLAVRSKAGTVGDADMVGGDVRGTVRRGTGPRQ